MSEMPDTVILCAEAGLSLIPAHPVQKNPQVQFWTAFQKIPATPEQIKKWFSNGHDYSPAIICGAVSGNLECLDFDEKARQFDTWQELVKEQAPDLPQRLVIQSTQNGGIHVAYRCPGITLPGNQKLSTAAISVSGPGEHQHCGKGYKALQYRGQWVVTPTLIETRGEGGYFLASPGRGYKLLSGSFLDVPLITPAERQILIECAIILSEYSPERPAYQPRSLNHNSEGQRPGDLFNSETTIQSLIEPDGWRYSGKNKPMPDGAQAELWIRPGKDKGVSGTVYDNKIHVFSSNCTPLEQRVTYCPFSYYTTINHHGDFHAAARSLAKNSKVTNVPETSGHSGKLRQVQNIPESSEHFRSASGIPPEKDRVIAQDVLAFIESDPAPFSNNDLYSELCVRDRRSRKTALDALYYYEKKNKISKIDGKRGWWEVTEGEPETMDLLSATTDPYNILLPLDISEHIHIRPGSIILLSGSNNSGKTVFLLTILRGLFRNTHIHQNINPSFINKREEGLPRELSYLNSEMSSGELCARIKGFGDDPAQWVQEVKFIERTHSFHKLVTPDGVTLIDYLEVNEDFFQAGKFLADIHKKLSNGLAIIAMQKKQGNSFAKGGEMTLEKPRLAFNLDKNEPHGFVCKITKAKEPVDFKRTIQGMERDFVIGENSKILPISDWRFVNEKQRRSINTDYDRNHLPSKVRNSGNHYKTVRK